MNKNVAVIASALFLFLLNSCGVFKGKNMETNEPIFGTKWKLVELNGTPVADKVNGKEPFISFDKETNRYSASGGCNGLGGEFELKSKQGIKFSRGMSTMMACQDMTIETGLNQLFGDADNYSIKDGVLTLHKGKGAPLAKFTAVQQQTAGLDGSWELDYLMSTDESFESLYPNKKPTITFDVAEGKVNGNSSCNNYFGALKIDGSSISFGNLGSTKMFCQGNGENVFFQNLEKVNTFSVNDDQLTFIMGDIAIMRFKRM